MLWTEAVALFGNGSVATEGAKKNLKQIGCNVAYLQGLSELVQAMKVHANTLHVMHMHVHYVISRQDMILTHYCLRPTAGTKSGSVGAHLRTNCICARDHFGTRSIERGCACQR